MATGSINACIRRFFVLPRVVKKKKNLNRRLQLSEIIDTLQYSCGAFVIPDDHHLSDVFLCVYIFPPTRAESLSSIVVKVKTENLCGTV